MMEAQVLALAYAGSDSTPADKAARISIHKLLVLHGGIEEHGEDHDHDDVVVEI